VSPPRPKGIALGLIWLGLIIVGWAAVGLLLWVGLVIGNELADLIGSMLS